VLRYLGRDEVREELGRQETAGLVFNYLGQNPGQRSDDEGKGKRRGGDARRRQALLRQVRGERGEERSRAARREHLLEINGGVSGGRLRLDWRYSDNRHRPETVEGLAASYLSALRELIEHCRGEDAKGYTLSDFPLARIDDATLGELIEEIDGELADDL
jgi:non-ribosomal peptide synthase protein (TIGR01720 family)